MLFEVEQSWNRFGFCTNGIGAHSITAFVELVRRFLEREQSWCGVRFSVCGFEKPILELLQ